jgi:hypothetical protein
MKKGWDQTIDSNQKPECSSLAFPPKGQISHSVENSLRSFKNASTTESNVFSGTVLIS